MLHTPTRGDDGYQATTYDAANRTTSVTTESKDRVSYNQTITRRQTLTQTFDGDGHAVKGQETRQTTGQSEFIEPPKYQMWSSVLNSALTEISGAGTKSKTKVFAGGAVIAEQMVLGTNLVQWISADPVTGSSVRIGKNGAFDNYHRKELEPLGQEVLPFEPPEEVPEPSNFNAVYSAEEPEWQCKASTAMGKSFFNQPVHCQKAQMESGGIGLGGLFSSKTEYNVKQIQPTDSPMPKFHLPNSASDHLLAYASRSTAKQTGDDDDGIVGEVEIKIDWDDSIPDFSAAENGGTDGWANTALDKKELSLFDVTLLKKKVSTLLTSDCMDFIKKLLDKTNEIVNQDWADQNIKGTEKEPSINEVYSDIMGLFNSVEKQGGFYGSRTASIATMSGKIKNKTGTVYLAYFKGVDSFDFSRPYWGDIWRKTYSAYMDQHALTAIHELIHFNFSDVSLAKGVAALNKDTKSRFSYSDVMSASRYWGNELKKNCGTAAQRGSQ